MSAAHPLVAVPFVQTLRVLNSLFRFVDKNYHRATNLIRRVGKRLDGTVFSVLDCRPGAFGYPAYRENKLEAALNETSFDFPPGFGAHCDERLVEYPWLFHHLPHGPGRLLDAGSVLNFDLILKQPKLSEKRVTITTLAPEDQAHWWKGVSYTYEDVRELSFRDHYFDWVVCVSTLEHVGLDNARFYTKDSAQKQDRPTDYLAFFDQLRRVLKPGGVLYLTVPFGKYSHEGWLQVFDESMIRGLVERFQPKHSTADYFRYDGKGWVKSTAASCADARYFGQKATGSNPLGVVAAESVVCLKLHQ